MNKSPHRRIEGITNLGSVNKACSLTRRFGKGVNRLAERVGVSSTMVSVNYPLDDF